MFDATLTDKDFQDAFAQRNSDWIEAARRAEPDLDVDGLRATLICRLLMLLARGRSNVAR